MSVNTLRALLTLREAIREAEKEAFSCYGEENFPEFKKMRKLEAAITKKVNRWDTQD